MLRKSVFAFFAATIMLLGPAAAAQAQTYNSFKIGDFTVSVTQIVAGGPITVTVCCFANGSSVTFTIFSNPVVLGTATANAQGIATGTFTVPAGLSAGAHHIEAKGTNSAGAPVTFNSPTLTLGSTGGSGLARTGSSNNTVPIAVTGAGLVVVGAGLVTVVRRRRHTGSQAA